MKKLDIGQTVTILANLGVILGIAFLAVEIRLATLTTRAEMVSTFQDRWVAIDLSWQSEDFASAWAKAIDTPDELTTTEMVQLSGFLYSFVDQLGANEVLWDLGVFRAPQSSTATIIANNSDLFFGNEFSQAWWAESRTLLNATLVSLIDQEIEGEAQGNADFYRKVRARIAR